jgi:hypothetical protein
MAGIYTDVGAFIGADCAMVGVSLTAGVSPADGTEVDGPDINRDQWSDRGQSASFIFPFYADMASGEDLTISTQIQDSADGITYADYDGRISGAGTKETVFGGVAAAQDIYACHKHDIDIGLARQYLRVQTTVTLSASGTDTCGIGGVIVVGGQQELPGTGREADTGA